MDDLATDIIVLNQRDNVATMRRTMKSGVAVAVGDYWVELRQTIPAGHKVALFSISAGQELLKYGQVIGFAKTDIESGDWVHTHNVLLKSVGRDYGFCEETTECFLDALGLAGPQGPGNEGPEGSRVGNVCLDERFDYS